jgi:hypothetical protein
MVFAKLIKYTINPSKIILNDILEAEYKNF